MSDPSWSAVGVCSWILLAAWCSWAVLIRPHVSVEGRSILLRNSLVDVLIPAKLVDAVRVRSYLTISVGQRRYSSTAVGYRPSSVARGHADLARGLVTDGGKARIENPVAYTEDYLRSEVQRIKALPGDEAERVIRKVAYLPLATLVVLIAMVIASTYSGGRV